MKEELTDAIESRLDTIEELVDSLEDLDIDVDPIREALGVVWDELHCIVNN